ncbi:hypothetical protein [Pseudarthrobacter chlorophenolicus]|uniref:hypothetical protein n=1 Tax=Pseudarthrobacter chlorophenolicus TaxID=85085 RepID=UPI000A426B99|nr:hypothetical protein [Pseudarthrobacter chlorophenolicus]
MEHEGTDAANNHASREQGPSTLRASRVAGKTLNVPVLIILAIVVALALGVWLNPLPKSAELAILDRPATAADALPDGVSPLQIEGFTVRLAAEEAGIRYFLSGDQDRKNLCVTFVPDNHPTQWGTACGSGTSSDREIVRTGSNGLVSVVLVPDGYDASELEQGGFKKIHDNVYAARTPRVPGSN